MAVHLEFVVLGPPISNQQSTVKGRANLTAWKATIAGAVAATWGKTKLTTPRPDVNVRMPESGPLDRLVRQPMQRLGICPASDLKCSLECDDITGLLILEDRRTGFF